MTAREYHVISVYTDAQALEDGVLVDVRGSAPYPINRATRALFDAFTSKMGRLPAGLGRSPVVDITELAQLCGRVAERIRKGELKDGMVVLDHDGKTVWAMENETLYGGPPHDTAGWTVMFPDDY
jgi:hypothetical protein